MSRENYPEMPPFPSETIALSGLAVGILRALVILILQGSTRYFPELNPSLFGCSKDAM